MNRILQLGTTKPPSRGYWTCQLLGWGLYSASLAYSAIVTLPAPAPRVLLEFAVLSAAAIGLTQLTRIFMLRNGWTKLGMLALLPRLLVASLILAMPLAIAMHFMSVAGLWSLDAMKDVAVIESLPGPMRNIDPMLLRTLNWGSAFFIWMALYIGITSVRDRHENELRQSELIRALQSAELRLLKSQLNPHFLFNSLNSVRALVSVDPAGAQKAVTQLARMLRYTLGAQNEDFVTLERELETVDDYLALESLRFGERMRVDLDIAPDARRVQIPVMLLQTVVENGIKHGIAELPGGGVLRVSAALNDGALHIEVKNPRPSSTSPRQQKGSGLHNAAERLRLLFGSNAMLELDLSKADLAVTRIHIPQTVRMDLGKGPLAKMAP